MPQTQTAVNYRKKAEELRVLAESIKCEDARKALLRCADEYEELWKEKGHPN